MYSIRVMRQRFSQSLPLIGTLCLLIIGSAVLFTFTPADAIMDAQAIAEPPADVDEAGITEDAEVDAENAETDEVIPEPTQYELISDVADATATDSELGVVEGIYAAANDTVVLDQHYLNDVFVAGNNIVLNGTIDGDLFAAGSYVVVNGDVRGSVRAAASVIRIEGQVGRNVMVYGDTIEISDTAQVFQDLVFGGRSVVLDGTVVGNVTGSSDTFDQTGTVYGEIEVEDIEETKPEPKPVVTPYKILKLFICWLGLLALGLVVLHLFPKASRGIVERMRKGAGSSIGYGVLIIIFGPVALLILSVTLIGLPLAMVAGLLWIVLLVIAKLYVGTALGKLLLPKSATLVWPFVLGFSIVYVVTQVIGWFGWVGGLIGGVIMLGGIIWASGAIVHHIGQQCRTK